VLTNCKVNNFSWISTPLPDENHVEIPIKNNG
jgi:hypothetical protein